MAYVYDDSGEHDQLPSREEVAARVDMWKRRLNALYDRIEGWLPSGHTADRTRVVLMREPIMTATGVPQAAMPFLVIDGPGGGKSYVRPDSLWLVGGNSRVVLTTPERSFEIVDFGTDENPDWRIYIAAAALEAVPFDRDTLRRALPEPA